MDRQPDCEDGLDTAGITPRQQQRQRQYFVGKWTAKGFVGRPQLLLSAPASSAPEFAQLTALTA
eukprot:SAG11_NODE_31604_length_290_cov_1.345550_1_plen_63_part_01